ncbi:MAG: hypothetical protein ACYT04_85240, partial [Nostoc sp.]
MIKIQNEKWSRYYLSILIVIILGAFLRFFMLANQSLWYDEGFSLINSDVSTFQESLSRVRHIG